MTTTRTDFHPTDVTIAIIRTEPGNATAIAAGKLADAELHFVGGLLDGLKLVGFAIFKARGAGQGFNVTYPTRTYAVNGERRGFSLLRAVTDNDSGELRRAILRAFVDAAPATPVETR